MDIHSADSKQLIEELELNNQSKSKPAEASPSIKALFRGYFTRKYFSYSISHLSNVPEIFSSFSTFKLNFSSFLHQEILDALEKCGMYFTFEQLSGVSWNTWSTEEFLYYGEFDNEGRPSGKGIFFTFEYFYEGFWKAGHRHGHGRFITKHWIYIGNWASNWRTGKGTMIFPGGLILEGDFFKTMLHGYGTLQKNSQYINGWWKNNAINGFGKQVTKVWEYEGQFVDNKYNGNGHMIDKNIGFEYWGNFAQSKGNGKGVYKDLKTGWFYEGEFKNCEKNGFFILRHPNHGIKHCFYVNNNLFGNWIHYKEDISLMDKGYFIDGCMHRHMNRIKHFIYLGDIIAANDRFWLNYVGVKGIVRVLHNESMEKLPEFTYLDINIKDNEAEDIIQHISEVVAFVKGWKSKGYKVLFHCKEGVSLSPAVSIAYLTVARKVKFNSAFETVKRFWPCISLSDGLIKQLSEMRAKKSKKN